MKKLIGLIAMLGFIATAQANESFTVSAKLYDNKKLIGSPTVVVTPKNEASISVGEVYSISFTLTPGDGSIVNLATDLKIGKEHTAPSFSVELDKEATINIGDNELSVLVSKSSS